MLIPYWIQKADFSHEDFDAVDYRQAEVALKNFDWRREKQYQQELETSERENCDPGIGFPSDDGRILHICPDGTGKAYFHYHYSTERKFLWIIPYTSDEIATVLNINELDFGEIIKRFFLSDHEWLINKTREFD